MQENINKPDRFYLSFLLLSCPIWHYRERPSLVSLVLISLDPDVWSKWKLKQIHSLKFPHRCEDQYRDMWVSISVNGSNTHKFAKTRPFFPEVWGQRHMFCNVFTMSMDFIEVDYIELCCSTYNQDSQDGKPFAELIGAALAGGFSDCNLNAVLPNLISNRHKWHKKYRSVDLIF